MKYLSILKLFSVIKRKFFKCVKLVFRASSVWRRTYVIQMCIQMMDYANGPLLFGKISSISITSFWRLPLTYPNNRGVNVGFDLYVVQGTNVTEILDLLNELSNNSHYFHIRGVEGHYELDRWCFISARDLSHSL